jgi:hypothetical protein
MSGIIFFNIRRLMSAYVDEPKTEEEYEEVIASVDLPGWMDYPKEKKNVYEIVTEGERFKIVETGDSFTTFEEAYDFIDDALGGDQIFPTVSEELRFGKNDTDRRVRGFISFTFDDRERMDKYSYWVFLQLNEQYEKDPEDWVTAHRWLQHHPAFYHRYELDMNDWATDSGLDDIYQYVSRDDQGGALVTLEHGTWNDKGRTGQRYVDPRLAVTADTFEEAFVLLAKRVRKNFSTDGVDYGKREDLPKWYEELEERLLNE